MMKTSLFYKDEFERRWEYESYYYKNVYPIVMPDLSFDITKFTYAFGYGKFSAGMIDIAKGKKKFGVLGQHEKNALTTSFYGASDNWNYSNTTGYHHLAITFLPVADGDTTEIANN
jgi:hypothetical protein